MSGRELERVEVMGRVAKRDLKLSDAAALLELSYRQSKRVWRRYREAGGESLTHGNAGRPSNRGKPGEGRRPGVDFLQEKESRTEQGGIGPTVGGRHFGREGRLGNRP